MNSSASMSITWTCCPRDSPSNGSRRAVLAGEQPAIGDRDAMGIAPEIMQHLLRAAERTLGIDIPFDLAQRPEMPGERSRLHQADEIAEEHELPLSMRLQTLQEQPAKQSREDANRQEEVGPAADPASIG